MFTEQFAALTRLHQFDETQLNGARLDPVEKGIELMMVHIAHQHGVDFNFCKTGIKRGIDARHHLLEFILPGNRVELTRIKAIDANVNAGQASLAPVGGITRQTVAIGGYRQLTNRLVFTHGGNDVGEITTQRGFATGQTHFFSAQVGKGAGHPANFIDGEKTFIGDAAGLVTIRQAVCATKVTHVGNRQTQVVKLARESIGQLCGHVHLSKYGRRSHFFLRPGGNAFALSRPKHRII